MKTFLPGEILLQMIVELGWSQSELARRAGRKRAVINDVILGKYKVGRDLGVDLARAFNMSPESLFQKLGLFPTDPDADETLDRINHLYTNLKDPSNKQKAVEFMEFLQISEEKAKYNAKSKKS